jgi:hypothetical protein
MPCAPIDATRSQNAGLKLGKRPTLGWVAIHDEPLKKTVSSTAYVVVRLKLPRQIMPSVP